MSVSTVDAIDAILDSPTAAALFASAPDAHKRYKTMLREVHPDMVGDADKKRASEAFVRLNALWEVWQTSGAQAGAGGRSGGPTVIRTRRHEFSIEKEVGGDEVFSVYEATYDAGHRRAALLIANDAADEDLVAAYRKAIKSDFNEDFRAFYPTLIESFRYSEGGAAFPALALELADGMRFFSIAEIADAYRSRGGIHGRDVAWMWRRMLVALGNAHEVGLLHGAPVAEAWRVEPDQHGIVLTGWQYSVELGQVLTAIPNAHRDLYPASVFDKQVQAKSLDINIAAQTLLAIANPAETPKAILAHLKGCTYQGLPSAAQLLAEFDEVLDRVYGGKQFHIFKMPPV